MRQFFLVMACLLLAACSRGPDVNTLEADVKARLQQVFGNQLQLSELQRRGSATDSLAPVQRGLERDQPTDEEFSRLIDRLTSFVAIIGQAMPSFWLGLILMITLGLQLGWLPSTGRGQTAELFAQAGLCRLAWLGKGLCH